jgi:hypothetical protein
MRDHPSLRFCLSISSMVGDRKPNEDDRTGVA